MKVYAFKSISLAKVRNVVVLLFILLALPLTIFLLRQQQELRQRAALPECSSSLQAKINAAPVGGTVLADRCIYRETITINKPIILDGGGGAYGEGGAEIRGSDVWASWNSNGDGTWTSTDSVPGLGSIGGDACTGGRCAWPEQVFRNGIPLEQLSPGSRPGSGQFALVSSGDRRVWVGDNPNGALMEVTTRPYWIYAGSNNVTVRGFTMKHSATLLLRGGIELPESINYTGWTFEDLDLSHSHFSNLHLGFGAGHTLNRVISSFAGNMGILNGASTIASFIKVHNNHTESYGCGWGCGGWKTTGVGTTVQDSEFYDNAGPAFWLDIDGNYSIIRRNKFYRNSGVAIFHEISTGGKIHDNCAWQNGTQAGWGYGGAFQISSSADVEIYNNTLWDNTKAIMVFWQDRPDRGGRVGGVYVHDNKIIQDGNAGNPHGYSLSWLSEYPVPGAQPFQPSSNNRGTNNRYFPTNGEWYSWDNDHSSLSAFNATPGEEGGAYMSTAEKDAAIAACQSGGPTPTTSPTPGGPTPTPPPGRRPYPDGSLPKQIPGTIQAEDYDIGGEGVSYHDTDSINQGGAYRSDGVDVKMSSDTQ